MADSGAIRQRRSKAHKAGDHSLCGSRCSQGAPRPLAALRALPSPAESSPDLDPAAEMRALAVRLAAAHEAEPSNALLARELRATLKELMPKDAGNADADLTGLFAALQA